MRQIGKIIAVALMTLLLAAFMAPLAALMSAHLGGHALPGPAPSVALAAQADGGDVEAAADEDPDIGTLLELMRGAFAGPAAAGAFVSAGLAFLRARTGRPKGMMAVVAVAGGSLAVGVVGAFTGGIGGAADAAGFGSTLSAGVIFGFKTFAAAVAERELVVNALRSMSGEPQSDARQDSARHRATRG